MMGIFSKHGGDVTKEEPVTPPPIFINKSADALKKMPSSRRLDVLHSSSPDLSFGNLRRSAPPKRATPRRRSFAGSLPPKSSSPNVDIKSISTTDYSLRRSNSNDGSRDESYIIEEFEFDDASYEEVVIEDDGVYFVEEEILEEVIIQERFPTREFKIRFDDFDELQTTLHINDYSPGEVENTWYSRADYDKMVKKARDAVSKVDVKEEAKSLKSKKKEEKEKKKGEKKKKDKEKNQVEEEVDGIETDAEGDANGGGEKSSTNGKKIKKAVDVRGLEGWSTSGSLEIRALKQKAVDAVWNEQNRQFSSGDFDVEKIREAYRTVSAEAEAIAQTRGANDRAEADKIHGRKDDHKQLRFIRHAVLISKATRKVKEAVAKKKAKKKKKEEGEEVVEPMKRNIVRQPSQGSRLIVDEGSFEFTLDESGRTSNSKNDGQSRKPRRPSLLARTPSWESGLSSGKY